MKLRQRPFLEIYPPDFNLVRVQMLNRRGDTGLGPGTGRPSSDRNAAAGTRRRESGRLLQAPRGRIGESHQVCPLRRSPSPACRGANQRLEDGCASCRTAARIRMASCPPTTHRLPCVISESHRSHPRRSCAVRANHRSINTSICLIHLSSSRKTLHRLTGDCS